ncbi:MAG: TnpV protein [Lachnospiraceae bacterium]
MNLTYQKNGDYYIPNITSSQQEEIKLTKYGLMRKEYLKEFRKGLYSGMILSGTLWNHLKEVEEQAKTQMERLTAEMMKNEGVTEELKEKSQMMWLQKRVSIQNRAEEQVLSEVIYN